MSDAHDDGPSTEPITRTRRVVAHNFAAESENRIHADDVAQQYGFRGGLVPGVTSYAYVIDAVVDRFGPGWPWSGRCVIRLGLPVYEGEEIEVRCEAGGGIGLRNAAGQECVSGRAGLDPVARAAVVVPAEAPLPSSHGARPFADEESLAPGTVLGTLRSTFTVGAQQEYLDAVGIDEPRWAEQGLAHPGYLLLDANAVLVDNVLLGPWIHVGSDVSLLAPVLDGQSVEVRSQVTHEYERKGHRFVEFDVVTLADDQVASFVHHTAIHRPRPVGG